MGRPARAGRRSVSRFRTGHFPEAVVRAAVGGRCQDFAVALHRMTGWPIAALWKHPAGDGFDLSFDPVPVHVFCVEPSGRAVDVEGLSSFDDLTKAYCRREADLGRHAVEIHGDESGWLMAARLRGSDMADFAESAVNEADDVIRASESFLRLVESLQAAAGDTSQPRTLLA